MRAMYRVQVQRKEKNGNRLVLLRRTDGSIWETGAREDADRKARDIRADIYAGRSQWAGAWAIVGPVPKARRGRAG